jgi:hypothetical protein
MIPVPRGVRVWLATGPTDMRRGMNGLALPRRAPGPASLRERIDRLAIDGAGDAAAGPARWPCFRLPW